MRRVKDGSKGTGAVQFAGVRVGGRGSRSPELCSLSCRRLTRCGQAARQHHPCHQQQRRSPAAPGMTLEGQPIGQGAAPSKMHKPPLGSLSSTQGETLWLLWTIDSWHPPSFSASSETGYIAASRVLLCTNKNKGCRPFLTRQTLNMIAGCKPDLQSHGFWAQWTWGTLGRRLLRKALDEWVEHPRRRRFACCRELTAGVWRGLPPTSVLWRGHNWHAGSSRSASSKLTVPAP